MRSPSQAPDPLTVAHDQGAVAATVGFDWPDWRGVAEKVQEELIELREAIESADAQAILHEYGDVLMAVATLGRHIGAHPATALDTANARFADRFALVGALARARGQALVDLDAAALDSLWREAKLLSKPVTRETPP